MAFPPRHLTPLSPRSRSCLHQTAHGLHHRCKESRGWLGLALKMAAVLVLIPSPTQAQNTTYARLLAARGESR